MSTLKKNILISFFAAMGIVLKVTLAPIVNVITDFLFIPGGSAITGISISLLLLGPILIEDSFTATKMALLQALLALFLGSSSFQGPFIIVSYTLPGIVIDLIMNKKLMTFLGERETMALAGVLAVTTGAFITNTAFFRLDILPLILFILVGAVSGVVGCCIAYNVYEKLLVKDIWRKII